MKDMNDNLIKKNNKLLLLKDIIEDIKVISTWLKANMAAQVATFSLK